MVHQQQTDNPYPGELVLNGLVHRPVFEFSIINFGEIKIKI